MAGRKIKLKDQLGRVIRISSGLPAQPGQPAPAPAQPDRPSPSATVWKLIREIPQNIQKLAKLVGAGFTTRGPDGEWRQRTIEAGEGIAVTNGDGVGGDPAIALAELANAGGGTLQKTLRDSYGRVAGTSAATTDDLGEGAGNLYYTDERVDARLAAAYRRGLYQDRPAAASVKNGSIFAAKDVKENYASDGVTWMLLPSGGNELGYAERTSDFNAPAGTTVDVPGLSVTAMVGDGDVVVNFGGTLIMNMTAPNEYANLILYVDGAYASQLLARAVGGYIVVSRAFRVSGLTPGVAHTFKLGLQSIGALHAQLAAVNEDRPYIQVVTI